MTNALATLASDSPLYALRETLERQLETRRDLITDTRRITLGEPSPDMPGGGPIAFLLDHPLEGTLEYGMRDYAHGQMADALQVPVKFWRRLQGDHPDLLCGLGNGLLEREPVKRMIRTLDGQVRAYLSDRYRRRDNFDLMDKAILPALAEHGRTGLYFKSCELTESRMYVKVVLPDREWPITPKVGDVIRGGLIIKNSEVGAGALVVAPYTDRLICQNGMVHTDFGQRSAHVGGRQVSDQETWELYSDTTLALDDAAFFAKCRDTVAAVLNEQVFESIVSQMRDLAGLALANPVGAVEDMTRRHDLTKDESDAMVKHLMDEGPTGWGLVNALTATARDHDSADRRVELEGLAGRITADWSLAGVRS